MEREEAIEGGVKAKSKWREEEDKNGKEKAIPHIQPAAMYNGICTVHFYALKHGPQLLNC